MDVIAKKYYHELTLYDLNNFSFNIYTPIRIPPDILVHCHFVVMKKMRSTPKCPTECKLWNVSVQKF